MKKQTNAFYALFYLSWTWWWWFSIVSDCSLATIHFPKYSRKKCGWIVICNNYYIFFYLKQTSSWISLLLKHLALLLCIHFREKQGKKVPRRKFRFMLTMVCNNILVVVHLQKFVVDKLLEAESHDTKWAK